MLSLAEMTKASQKMLTAEQLQVQKVGMYVALSSDSK